MSDQPPPTVLPDELAIHPDDPRMAEIERHAKATIEAAMHLAQVTRPDHSQHEAVYFCALAIVNAAGLNDWQGPIAASALAAAMGSICAQCGDHSIEVLAASCEHAAGVFAEVSERLVELQRRRQGAGGA